MRGNLALQLEELRQTSSIRARLRSQLKVIKTVKVSCLPGVTNRVRNLTVLQEDRRLELTRDPCAVGPQAEC